MNYNVAGFPHIADHWFTLPDDNPARRRLDEERNATRSACAPTVSQARTLIAKPLVAESIPRKLTPARRFEAKLAEACSPAIRFDNA
jgi:hypothetical protein